MQLKKVIARRRAYRSLEPIRINDRLIMDLAFHARLAPSCFNHQPWRFIFVTQAEQLNRLQEAVSGGNAWTRKASLVIAVFTRKDLDCLIKERQYDLFDTGMATALLILRATDLGLVAHPIAGYKEELAKNILAIPDDYRLITLVIVGKRSSRHNPDLSEKQLESETRRPSRKSLEEFVFLNSYHNPYPPE